jgi:preprotein translocase subunit SecA
MPAAREHTLQVLGEALLHDLERKLTLLAIDECWSEHLAAVAEIRDGIHLAELGGLWPLAEFQKQAAESFDHGLQSVEARMVERFASLDITSEGVEMDQMGLLGPSSTWTYLVDDHASTDRLAASLVGRRNIGFAVDAALTGPLFMLWVLSRHLLRRGRR